MKLALPLSLTLLLSLKLVGCASSDVADAAGGEAGSENDGGEAGHPGHAGQTGHAGAGAIDQCCILGAVCHVVGGSSREVEECHHLGHENVASECAAHYEECMEICEGLSDDPEPHSCSL